MLKPTLIIAAPLAGRPGASRQKVNQVPAGTDARTVCGQLQQVVDRYVSPGLDAPVKLDLVGEVRSDAAVRDAVRRRQLLHEAFPGSGAARAMTALAARLAPDVG